MYPNPNSNTNMNPNSNLNLNTKSQTHIISVSLSEKRILKTKAVNYTLILSCLESKKAFRPSYKINLNKTKIMKNFTNKDLYDLVKVTKKNFNNLNTNNYNKFIKFNPVKLNHNTEGNLYSPKNRSKNNKEYSMVPNSSSSSYNNTIFSYNNYNANKSNNKIIDQYTKKTLIYDLIDENKEKVIMKNLLVADMVSQDYSSNKMFPRLKTKFMPMDISNSNNKDSFNTSSNRPNNTRNIIKYNTNNTINNNNTNNTINNTTTTTSNNNIHKYYLEKNQ